MTSPCKREDGSYRAHFATAEEAQAFQQRPENFDVYGEDEVRFCTRCGNFHLSRKFWKKPWEIPTAQLRRN